MRELILNTNKLEDFEIGAELLALLSFPGADEEERRKKNVKAMANTYLASIIEENPWDGDEIRAHWAKYLPVDRTSLTGMRNRSRHAMEVGALALGYLKEPMTGAILALPLRAGRPSLRAMVRATRSLAPDQDREASAYKQVQRNWYRWMPVVHLAAAYRAMLNHAQLMEGPFPLDALELHRQAVSLANAFAEKLIAMPELPWASAGPVNLVWIE